jgi:hypothetical protein
MGDQGRAGPCTAPAIILAEVSALNRHWHDGNGVPDTEAEFTVRYMMLINHNDLALAKAPPSLRRDYAAGKVN